MPQKDILAAAYLKDKSRLADLLNACVFGGEQFIRPEDIREADCTEYPFERSEKSHKTQKGYRDLIQIVACGIQFFILGVENQSYVDYIMPIRVMKYDVSRYMQQIVSIKQEHAKKKDLSDDELLSGLSKNDRLHPVITLVLYYGKHWDGPRSLKMMLNPEGIPPELWEIVPDYRINIIEAGNCPMAVHFQTDLKLVFGFFHHMDDRDGLLQFIQTEQAGFTQLPADAYELISSLSNTKELTRLNEKRNEKRKGNVNMCKAIDDLIRDSKEKGKEELLKKLIRKNLSRNLNPESIADLLDVDLTTVQRFKTELEKEHVLA